MTQHKGSQQHDERERTIETGRENRGERGLTRSQGGQVFNQSRAPFSLMRVMDDMDRFFEDFAFGRTGFGVLPSFDRSALARATWAPPVETFRRGDKLVIRADLPGLKRDDVNVDVEAGVLRITGERKDEQEVERDGYYRTERTYGQFYRAIPLPEGLDTDQVDASFTDGVLEVTLPAPKETGQKRKRIQVR
jgi:HSP20 family protein